MKKKTKKLVRQTLTHAFLALSVVGLSVVDQVRSGRFVQAEIEKRTEIAMIPGNFSPFKSAAPTPLSIEERAVILNRTVQVSFVDSAGATPIASLSLPFKDYPLWIRFQARGSQEKAVVDLERVKQYVISYPPEGIPEPQSCILLSSQADEKGVLRAETDCVAKSGYVYDADVLASRIKDAFESGVESVEYVLTYVPAVITDPVSGSVIPMKHLSTGHSTFKGSGEPRKSNVRKALNEHVNNILVPADAVFSFNDTLGKVTTSRGWQMALTIFNGTDLRPAAGGGICQASTTTYRAALAAGLPIVEQKNHSLYVAYYEKFGVGQDATIFPGSQDLKFRNDTGGPILIQAYNIGDDAFVSIYGADDGRTVTLSGPYFGKTAPMDLLANGKKLKNNEIGWIRTVQMPGQEEKREASVARYHTLPKSLAARSELTTITTRGTTTSSGEMVSGR